eukprot:444271-Pyramimonas_sp.AAC.1
MFVAGVDLLAGRHRSMQLFDIADQSAARHSSRLRECPDLVQYFDIARRQQCPCEARRDHAGRS